MTVFSIDETLHAYATTFFPGRDADVGTYTVDGLDFRLLHLGSGRPLTSGPFTDYWQPVGASSDAPHVRRTRLAFLPRVSVETIVVGDDGEPDTHGLEPAPFVRWRCFESWTAFEEHVAKRNGRKLWTEARRRRRRLEEDLGSVELVTDEPGDEALDALIGWKTEQFESVAAAFADDDRHRAFIEHLRANGTAQVAALRAGNRVVAAHLGLLHDERFYSWMTAYASDAHRYGPGRMLLHHLLETSWERGDDEFDFLGGGEDFKWGYATHARLIGPLGREPRSSKLVAGVRSRVRAALPGSNP
jgi:hypothetical protein